MKSLIKYFAAGALVATIAACDKVADLPYYNAGQPITLASSVAATTPAEADADKTIITFSWGDAKFATDSMNTKYIFELAPAGTNFQNPVTRTLTPGYSTSFTAKELNDILYGYGFEYGVANDMEARVTGSYANNNDRVVSNTLPVKMNTYAKMAAPGSGKLFLVGDATQGGWSNPVPADQEFTKIDDHTFTGTFDLNGGKEFLILPVNGSWDHKYSVADNTIPYLNDGGTFGYDLAKNFPGPERSGKYKIDVDFNRGIFTVTQIGALPAPDQLFLVGGATPGGWSNPVPVPSQQFTKTADPNVFEITVPLKANDSYLFLPVNGDWSHKYGGNNPPTPLKGTLFADGDVAGSNTPSPTEDGTYKITVNFDTGKFWLVKQ